MPQLDISLFSAQLFWLFLSFSIVFLVLNYKILPKFEKIFSSRKNLINSAIEIAINAKKEAEEIKNECNLKINQAKILVSKDTADLKIKLKEQLSQKINETEQDLKQKLIEADLKIAKEKLAILDEVNELIANNVPHLVQKYINQSIDIDKIKLIKESDKHDF